MRNRFQNGVDRPSRKRRPHVHLHWHGSHRDRLDTADRWTWISRCERVKIERLQSLYGLPERWLAVAIGETERIISGHRTRARAERACKRWLQKGD